MFTSWMECNKTHEAARRLTYPLFVSKFVYVKKNRCWKPRKMGNIIGRLIWVPPTAGELFYLRRMVTVIKGPSYYEEIRTVNNIVYPTFRDVCEASGFLANNNEYIEAITEAKDWGSSHFLRKLFVTMLVCDSLNRPEVWEKMWHWLSDGILHRERITAAKPCIFKILTKVIFSFNTKIHVSNSDIIYTELQLSNDSLKILTLSEIEDLLQKNRRSFHQCLILMLLQQQIVAID